MKNCLGIEIGHYRIKIAYAEKGELKEFISERVQGMDLTDRHLWGAVKRVFGRK